MLLFKLINRVPNAVNQLKDIVENHIHQMGLEAIERINETALSVNFNLIIILIFEFLSLFRIRKFILKQFWIFIRNL
jgi:hypothetical protein